MKIHLIPNSHLDPVWLWDWREGLNEGMITCRTVLGLMEEFPDLTYSRGESVVYEHIQRTDPDLFAAIRQKIAEGRWEVIGGAFLQPDTNLPATETLVRHFTTGLGYFARELGRRPKTAWAADSFGHSAGWPEIYTAAGMDGFAFSRPMEKDYSLPKPAFWWEAASGARLLSWRIPVGWYGTDRDEVARRLDHTRAEAAKWGLENVAAFVGMGNHGGGPSRRQVRDIHAWAQANGDIEVIFSGLEHFFAALRQEAADLPVVRGELNFTLRGCYSSATRFKTLYRKTENLLLSAEKTDSMISAACERPPAELAAAWRAVLFNTFHDILPGSSIERAYDDQFAWLGVGWHEAKRVELAALNALSARINTTVETPEADMPCAVPIVVWNPHPYEYDGPVELEACLDYRPISVYANRVAKLPVEVLDAGGAPLAFQRLEPENYFTPSVPWRVRVAVRLRVPAFGWQVVRMAWKEQPRLAPALVGPSAASAEGGSIRNEFYRVQARTGEEGIAVFHGEAALFGPAGLRVASYEDTYGAWGGHDGERAADSIEVVKEYWQVERLETLARGPQKATLWARFGSATQRSRLDLTLSLHAGCERLHVAARLFCDEAGHRIKLILPISADAAAGRDAAWADFEVPGGHQERRPCGEVPGGRWVRTAGYVFASDAIFNFDLFADALNATLMRSARYSCSIPTDPDVMPWRPYMDGGEHRFQFAFAAPGANAFHLADGLEQPPVPCIAAAHPGPLSGRGSLGSLEPSHVRLLAFKPAEARDGGWIVRVQEVAGQAAKARFTIGAEAVDLGTLKPYQIATWKLTRGAHARWHARLVQADEAAVPSPRTSSNTATPEKSRAAITGTAKN